MKWSYIAAIVGILIVYSLSIMMLYNAAKAAMGLKEADLIYTPLALGRGPIGIAGAEVKNFRDVTILSLTPIRRILAFPQFFNVNAVIKVTCDGKEVYSYVDNFRMTEYGGLDRVVTISNLPSSSSCRAAIDLQCEPFGAVYCSDDVEATIHFEVPA